MRITISIITTLILLGCASPQFKNNDAISAIDVITLSNFDGLHIKVKIYDPEKNNDISILESMGFLVTDVRIANNTDFYYMITRNSISFSSKSGQLFFPKDGTDVHSDSKMLFPFNIFAIPVDLINAPINLIKTDFTNTNSQSTLDFGRLIEPNTTVSRVMFFDMGDDPVSKYKSSELKISPEKIRVVDRVEYIHDFN
ncbi:hypothetical protein [Nisaea sediminum]|uniref:hypothetical protein n=1 Tax=Nisaea sediminum TaxID=2775867 RepID=UPI001867365A|nr:hypothetical protein [Nisaea sediminum]